MVKPADMPVQLADELDEDALSHLQRLMGSWGMLADLSFADLLLFVPIADGDGSKFVVLGQMRPSTSQTLHRYDMVGTVMKGSERPLVVRCWELGEIVEGEQVIDAGRAELARSQCIPVRCNGRAVAILARESPYDVVRRTGELERAYVDIFDRFARMISDGVFPYASDEAVVEEAPRVSDGLALLDEGRRLAYVSPNAVNALHRMGVYSNATGIRMDELGVEESGIRRAFMMRLPVIEEVERKPDVIVLLRCIPLLQEGKPSGAVVLLRDVTDLRRRDRLLLSKDAAIREVHHRVKNNLQTISSLLRLQARRLTTHEGRDALREAEVRIGSIAAVHEILSREVGDEVPFSQIVPALVRMAEDVTVTSRAVHIKVEGDAGELNADVATPLAVVLSELLQNAMEHAFDTDVPGDDGARVGDGLVCLTLSNDGSEIVAQVRDNGVGLPGGFEIESSTSLGLSIVRDLVRSQLQGSIDMHSDGGTVVELHIPLPAAPLAPAPPEG